MDLTENENRTDVLLYECMASNSCYSNLWSIVRILLLLSHGQATVEKGFSVNKEVKAQNMAEETFTAQHLVCDHVNAAGSLMNVDYYYYYYYYYKRAALTRRFVPRNFKVT